MNFRHFPFTCSCLLSPSTSLPLLLILHRSLPRACLLTCLALFRAVRGCCCRGSCSGDSAALSPVLLPRAKDAVGVRKPLRRCLRCRRRCCRVSNAVPVTSSGRGQRPGSGCGRAGSLAGCGEARLGRPLAPRVQPRPGFYTSPAFSGNKRAGTLSPRPTGRRSIHSPTRRSKLFRRVQLQRPPSLEPSSRFWPHHKDSEPSVPFPNTREGKEW